MNPNSHAENEMVEDRHAENEMVKDQNDLKQPTVCLSSFNGLTKPCLSMKFDELEDVHACYNAYARQIGFSIRKKSFSTIEQ
jgi:hypothetical protein